MANRDFRSVAVQTLPIRPFCSHGGPASLSGAVVGARFDDRVPIARRSAEQKEHSVRSRRLATLITVLATAATLALTGSVVGPVTSSDASAGRYQWRADLDAASTAIPTKAQPTVASTAKSLLRAGASNTKATAVAAVSTECDGCSGSATTLQVVYFDGAGTVSADNVANAVSQCPGCTAGASSATVSVQVVIARRADQLVVNNRSFAANVDCVGCRTTACAVQFVLVGGSRKDLSAASKDLIGQLQDALAGKLAATAGQPSAQARSSAESATASTADQLQAVLVKDTGSTTVQRKVDVQVG